MSRSTRNDKGPTRDVAVCKGQLGTVRLYQRRFAEALTAFTDARERFEALGEPGTVAGSWHQIGVVHRQAGNSGAAEDAYRRSLAISVQRDDIAGQARTLGELGNLYALMLDRPEGAVTHYRQAADRYVELQDSAGEGRQRSNLAETLRRLSRRDEARREIERAIECNRGLGHAAESWVTWSILSDIERDEGEATRAYAAWLQARDAYHAYRREGGESRSAGPRLTAEIGQLLAANDLSAARALLQQWTDLADPPTWLPPMLGPLQAIVAGQRSPALADDPNLDYDDAAELLLLLDTLAAAGR